MRLNKEEAKKLIDLLPDGATWDDLMYEIYVKRKIEQGLEDIAAGRLIDHEEIRKEFIPE